MKQNVVYWDTETAPLGASELARMMPVFEPQSNLKDPDKIRENLLKKQTDWLEKAALSAITGNVLAIGVIFNGLFVCMDGGGDEAQLLKEWKVYVDVHRKQGHPFIGFCTHNFDTPFLQKRAWANNVQPMVRHDFDPYRQDGFIDLAWLWNNRNKNEHTNLNTVSRFLKVGEKSGSGADFATLWEKERGAAIAYLKQDVTLVQLIAERMGVVGKDDSEKLAF